MRYVLHALTDPAIVVGAATQVMPFTNIERYGQGLVTISVPSNAASAVTMLVYTSQSGNTPNMTIADTKTVQPGTEGSIELRGGLRRYYSMACHSQGPTYPNVSIAWELSVRWGGVPIDQ